MAVPSQYTITSRTEFAVLHNWYNGDCQGGALEIQSRIPPGAWTPIEDEPCFSGGVITSGHLTTDLILFRARTSDEGTYTTPIPTLHTFGPCISDAAAAALVVDTVENRSFNATANATAPDATLLANWKAANTANPLAQYVTGAGAAALIAAGKATSTDNLIQWASFKWGIPPEVGRAVADLESGWRQSTAAGHEGDDPQPWSLGDRYDGLNAGLVAQYPAPSRIDADSVYMSMGITQIKLRPTGHPQGAALNVETEPIRWQSTSFNLEKWGADVRYYYEGHATWITDRTDHRDPPAPPWPPYVNNAIQDPWLSLGAHFDPSPWSNAGMLDYIGKIQSRIVSRPWTAPGFAN